MYQDSITNFAESGEHKALIVRTQLPAFLVGAAMAGAISGSAISSCSPPARTQILPGRI